jgi:hypothetical protein
MRHIQLAMAALSTLAIAAALVIVAITSTERAENVWDLTGCTKGALDQIRCCDVSEDNGKCAPPPPDSGPPGSQHDLSGIGSETLTPSPLHTHDPSDIGTETFTPATPTPTTPQPSPPATPSTTVSAPPPNPCLLEPVCVG